MFLTDNTCHFVLAMLMSESRFIKEQTSEACKHTRINMCDLDRGTTPKKGHMRLSRPLPNQVIHGHIIYG